MKDSDASDSKNSNSDLISISHTDGIVSSVAYSPDVRESGIGNPGLLEFGKQLKESGIPLTIAI